MLSSIANLFGYLLNFIYSLVGNYGIAIILFSVLLKLILLPLSFKQQKDLKKSQKIQNELTVIREKNKNNPEKLNQEMMALYKRENMSPFSGCFSSIIQIILILAVFYLVRNPLTYMLKIPNSQIDQVFQYMKEQENTEISTAYPQIGILKFVNSQSDNIETEKDGGKETLEIKAMKINMNFLGLDLSEIPQQNYSDIKVFIIPVLYVVSSIISIKITTNNKGKSKEAIEQTDEKKGEEVDMMGQMGRSMSLTMPILAVSVSLIAPLGLALYWLTNNILMIFERLIINKFIQNKEGEDENA